ncbi:MULTISPECIES: hypothetical protein [Streptomyces]
MDDAEACRHLYTRLKASLAKNSPPEHDFFKAYCARISRPAGLEQPALLPQVHLHYDPYTKRERGGSSQLVRERMDFLMLLPNAVRAVLEIDGIQHYSTEDEYTDAGRTKVRHLASTRKYATMMAADRRLRLAGYEVHRFGGVEFTDSASVSGMVDDFFDQLLADLSD